MTRVTAPDASGLRIAYVGATDMPASITPFDVLGVDQAATTYERHSDPDSTTVTAPGAPVTTYFFDGRLRAALTQVGDAPALAAAGDIPARDGAYVGATPSLTVDAAAAGVADGIDELSLQVDGSSVDQVDGDCDDACPTRLDGRLVYDLSGASDGAHNVMVSALDGAANRTDSAQWTVFLDRTAPPAPTRPAYAGFDDEGTTAYVTWANAPTRRRPTERLAPGWTEPR